MEEIHSKGWRENEKLVKSFEFDNFIKAIDFVNMVADLAEKANHHPDILIHNYKNVKITLFTHEQNKITEKDFKLARKIESL